MRRFLACAFAVAITSLGSSVRADDPNAIIDKATKALGGRGKLEKLHASELKTKGTINLGGNKSAINGQATVRASIIIACISRANLAATRSKE